MIENSHTAEEVIAKEGTLVSTTVGVSMLPLLRNRRDTVILSRPNGRLKKYDVPLYRREDKLILHRIVDVTDSGYVICGDNCESLEYDITDDNIIGVMTSFYRGDKFYTVDNKCYIAYSKIHVALYPFRKILMKLRRGLSRIYHLIINK